jgi:hypothetical protein
LSGLTVIACASDVGNCCIMCTKCGHVFVDGEPFTDESHEIDSVTLAKALYYHRCDMGRSPDIVWRSRGKRSFK